MAANQAVQTITTVSVSAASTAALDTAIAAAVNTAVKNQQNTPGQMFPGNQSIVAGTITVVGFNSVYNGTALVYYAQVQYLQMVEPT